MTTFGERLAGWRTIAQRGYLGRYALGRLLVASGLSSRLTMTRGDYRLRFYPSALSLTLWASPDDRESDEAFVRAWLEPGDTYIDVGANIGALALAASATVGPEGRVVAIEAHPRTCGFLQGNVALNRRENISTINVAVGDQPGEVYFSDERSDDQNAVSDTPTRLRVAVATLDALPLPSGPVALLKVDVEGYERFVFAGAGQVLARTEAVYFEAWERHFRQHHYSAGDVVDLLMTSGFRVYRLGHGPLTEVGADFQAVSCENLLALRTTASRRLARACP